MLGAEGVVMTASCDRIGALVLRMQSDFLDVPTLTLTLTQAQQRFGVDTPTCEAILGTLVDAGVLANVEGVYARFFPRGQQQIPRRSFVGHAA
jgi:hypothetical protein